MSSFRGEYGESEHGNFKVVDSIPLDHAFCVTASHIAYAAQHCCGILDEHALEESGIPCGVKGCQLSPKEHKYALLISGAAELTEPDDVTKPNPELHAYLLKIKDECIKNGYEGFAFMRKEDYDGANRRD